VTDGNSRKTPAPWLAGIIDTLVGARLLRRSTLPHRNRLAVILLDTAFETACRAFLRYCANIRLEDAHKNRDNLVKAVRAKLPEIDPAVWESIHYYYQEIRCDFYHHSAGKTITDEATLDYQETVEFVIDRAFDMRSGSVADMDAESAVFTKADGETSGTPSYALPLARLKDQTDKVLLAVSVLNPSKVGEVNEFLRREGDSLRLTGNEFTNTVARNTGSKRMFYFNKEFHRWELSGLGRYRLKQLAQGASDE
jgi:hypothetical protein